VSSYQKTFDYFGFGSPGETKAEFAKFFGSFFQKRTAFCCLPWPGAGQFSRPGQLQKNQKTFAIPGCGLSGSADATAAAATDPFTGIVERGLRERRPARS
jgi:hypothetical protein